MRKRLPPLGVILAGFVFVASGTIIAAEMEPGLVLLYGFDEAAGTIVHDQSGNGNDGKIIGGVKRIKGPFGSALEFDGQDGYVNGGPGPGKSLDIASGGTVMVWARAKKAQGGLVCWVVDESWPGARLLLTVDTYHGGANTIGCMADGKTARGFKGFGTLRAGEWTHLAYSFDGKTVSTYRDGTLTGSIPQSLQPDVKGVDLWIGRCLGLGQQYFHGALDEVRVYDRPLSGGEIRAYYKREGPARGKDMTLLYRPVVEVQAYRGPGKIVATLDATRMQPLPRGAALRAGLCRPGVSKPIQQLETRDIPERDATELIFDVQELPAGTYAVRASAVGPDGARIGEESSVPIEWKGRLPAFKNVKILNNLCWELLNVRDPAFIMTEGMGRLSFAVPRDRWVLIRTTAEVGKGGAVGVRVDSHTGDAAIAHSQPGESTLEAMRYLKAGAHTLHIAFKGKADLKHVVVRAIPELQHAFYGADPRIRPCGPYDWDFLKKHVLPHVNVMLAGLDHYRRGDAFERLKEWKKMGRGWIAYKALPWDKQSTDEVYEYWSNTAGFQHPLVDGLIIDEANGGDLKIYDYLREAVERMHAHPKFRGKAVNPYCDALYGMDRSTEFARACLKGGGNLCWEVYFIEEPTLEEAGRSIHRRLLTPMPKWEGAFPGCVSQMVVVLGYMSAPVETLSIYPTVDFKVFMDMQVRALATHPAFFGLGGIQEYHCGYSDEENVRWAAHLYRHYAIEGNTEPVNNDPYMLPHIRNPGFTDGATGWRVEPAEANSIQAKSHKGYGILQGRTLDNRKEGLGDTFLWMKRSAGKPNAFSQEIRNLTPGRLYSMKMITSDYQDLVKERSDKKPNAVSVKLDNAEIVPGPKNAFQYTIQHSRQLGKFNAKYKYWINYHWRVFRAKGKTGNLTVSDWTDSKTPGGPIGQELMFSFIEIQPYFGN